MKLLFQIKMLDIETWNVQNCKKIAQNRVQNGFSRLVSERNFWTNDWESFYKVVKEHDAFHLLHQRISNKAMQEFLNEHPNLMPEGLNVDSRYTVTVTRAS